MTESESSSSGLYSTPTTTVTMQLEAGTMKAVKLRKVQDTDTLAKQIRHVNVQAALGLKGLCVERAEADHSSENVRIRVTMRLLRNPLGKYLEEQKDYEENRARNFVLEVAEILAVAEIYVCCR